MLAESLDELTSMVAPLFTPIKNRRLPIGPPPTLDSPWGPEQEGVREAASIGVSLLISPTPSQLCARKPSWTSKPLASNG
jgi:hypothetical protein